MIEWVPTDSDEMVNVAISAATLPVPGEVEPSKKVTEPVGVKAAAWLDVVGLAGKASADVVPDWLTIWLTADDVLVVKFVSPP